MKKKSLAVIVLAGLMLVGCGKDTVSETVRESETMQVSEQVTEATQDVNIENKESSPITEKEESKTQTESTEAVDENAWVPDAFVYNDVTTLDFVAPVVHNGDGEPCTFLWNRTEEDLKEWYLEKFGEEEGTITEYVNNRKNGQFAGEKDCNISKRNYAEKEAYSVYYRVGNYHESNVNHASFTIENKEQEVVIAQAKDFLEMMGFGEYAEDIIFSEELTMEIPTENDKGVYRVSSDYGADTYDQNYSIRVSVEYSDFDFTRYFWGYDAVGLESWEDYFSLADYLEYSEFDTSSLEALAASERPYIEVLYGNVYDQNVSVDQEFSYRRYDFERLDDIEFDYSANCKDSNEEIGGLSINFKQEEEDVEFKITAYGRQPFENRSEKRWVNRGEDITLEERQELCEARLQLMKKLDHNIDWTTEDLLNSFNDYEFNEDCDKTHYYGDGYEYHIMNSLSGLSLYGEFELKEEETIEE